jgi:hypothetical protein
VATRYGFWLDFCEAKDPESKGAVEALVRYAKSDLAVPAEDFGEDLGVANTAAARWCAQVNAAVHFEIHTVLDERLAVERDVLRTLPSLQANLRRGVSRKVDKLATVRIGSVQRWAPTRCCAPSSRPRSPPATSPASATGCAAPGSPSPRRWTSSRSPHPRCRKPSFDYLASLEWVHKPTTSAWSLYRGVADNSVGRVIDTLLRHDLVIVDEVGFAPLDDTGTQLLFRFRRVGLRTPGLASLHTGPSISGGQFLPEHLTATSPLDRRLHHAIVVVAEGESFRMREARTRAGWNRS